jgi:hypothetical protein
VVVDSEYGGAEEYEPPLPPPLQHPAANAATPSVDMITCVLFSIHFDFIDCPFCSVGFVTTAINLAERRLSKAGNN